MGSISKQFENAAYQSNVAMGHIKAMRHVKGNVAYQSNVAM
jgi:hypothetical protein